MKHICERCGLSFYSNKLIDTCPRDSCKEVKYNATAKPMSMINEAIPVIKEVDSNSGEIKKAICSICGKPMSIFENMRNGEIKEYILHCSLCNKTSRILANQGQEIQAEESKNADLNKKAEQELKQAIGLM